MNINDYFKKIYTVAFRLTGSKKSACELTEQAISSMYGKIDTEISDCIFKSTVLELCALFLQRYDGKCYDELEFDHNPKDKLHEIQKALLSLTAVSRTIIIWKDFLGFQLSDLIHIINKDRTELNTELFHARMQVKEALSMKISL